MVIIIPARYASKRLPGKALLDVCGKPLIQRVHETASASGAKRVIIATDDARIRAAAESFGATVCMTAAGHESGTDRLAETIDLAGIEPDEIVVNLQGDEPLIPPELLETIAHALADRPDAAVATACYPIRDPEEFGNPNVVKLVRDKDGFALYFSRAPIPWPRGDNPETQRQSVPSCACRHIGLYAYRAEFVKRFAAWPPCPPEQSERLEQLRVLWHGERIYAHACEQAPGEGVDTEEDLERVRKYYA